MIVIALIINLIISLVIANAAKYRNISTAKVFWISFILTPILGMFVSMMSRQLSEEEIKKIETQEEPLDSADFAPIVGFVLFIVLISLVCFGLSRKEEKNYEYSSSLQPDREWEEYKRIEDSTIRSNISSLESPYRWEKKKVSNRLDRNNSAIQSKEYPKSLDSLEGPIKNTVSFERTNYDSIMSLKIADAKKIKIEYRNPY